MPARRTRRQLMRGAGQSAALVVAGGSLGCNGNADEPVGDGEPTSDDALPAGAVAVGPVEGLRSDRWAERNARFPNPEGKPANIDVFLRTDPDSADDIIAMSSRCTHLGCPVRYVARAQIFSCPCHGAAFDFEGDVVGGPTEQPLARFTAQVVDEVVYLLPINATAGSR